MDLSDSCYKVELDLIGDKKEPQMVLKTIISGLGRVSRPMDVLVDTGASMPLVLRKIDAISLQAKLKGKKAKIIGIGLRNRDSLILNKKAKLSLRTSKNKKLVFNAPVEVMTLSNVKRKQIKRHFSFPILGLAFLRKYNILVDTGETCLWVPKKQ